MSKAQTLPEIEVVTKFMTDFPTAWKVMKATQPDQHHEKCSYRVSNGGVLCDCAAEKAFIETVRLAQNWIGKNHSTQIEKIRELVYSCLYDRQWVEVATPSNFEAGKLNITKFDDLLDKLNEGNS